MASAQPSRIDFIRAIGAQKTKRYFNYLGLFLGDKLSKTKFTKLAVHTIGKDHIPLHNRLLISILNNARIPKGKGTASEIPKADINEKGIELNGASGSDPKGKGVALNETVKGKEVSGKTPNGPFGEALDSPAVKNGDINNGKYAALEHNKIVMQKGKQSGVNIINDILGTGVQKGNVSNNGMPAGGGSAINEIRGTGLQNETEEEEDDDVVIIGVKMAVNPINNFMRTGSHLNPFVSGPQTGFNNVQTGFNPNNNNLMRAGMQTGQTNGASGSGSEDAIDEFFRKYDSSLSSGTGQQIGNPRANYASGSGSGTGVQGGLNPFSNLSRTGLQAGIQANYASNSGGAPQAINPFSNNLSRGPLQFCNFQRTQAQNGPITAPFGLPSDPSRKRPHSSLDSGSCYNTRELPDSEMLYNRLSKRLREQGMGMTPEAAELMNRRLHEYVMNVISLPMDLVRARYANQNPNPNPNGNPDPNFQPEIIDLTDDGDEENAAGPSTSSQPQNPNFGTPRTITINDMHQSLLLNRGHMDPKWLEKLQEDRQP